MLEFVLCVFDAMLFLIRERAREGEENEEEAHQEEPREEEGTKCLHFL